METQEQSIDTLMDELGGFVRIVDYELFNPDENSFGLNPLQNAPKSYETSCVEIKRFIKSLLEACNNCQTLDDQHRFRDIQYPFEEILRNGIFHGNKAAPTLLLSLKLIVFQ